MQVQKLARDGVVVPEEDQGKGRGKVRRYSESNLLDFLLVKELRDYGLSFSRIESILRHIYFSLFSTHWLYIYNMEDGEIAVEPLLSINVLGRLSSYIVIDLKGLIKKLREI